MKWKIIISSFAVSLLLTGCQLNERSEESSMSNNRSDSSNVARRSENNLPLKETEYGRGATSDGNDTNANEEATRILTEEATSIIIYFSRSGNTENLARMIHNQKWCGYVGIISR